MIRTISMRDARGKNHNIDLELERGDLDIAKAIVEATKEYCRSTEGRRLLDSGKPITFENFINDVPNKTCLKYGFVKSGHTMSDISVSHDTPILAKEDMFMISRSKGLEQSKAHRVSEISMVFAYMYGIMETVYGKDRVRGLSFDNDLANFAK